MFEKTIGWIRNIWNKIRNICKEPTEFLASGRAGGMILCTVTGTQFLYLLVCLVFSDVFSKPVAALLSLVTFVLACELLAIVLKLIFGRVRRCRTYFLTAFAVAAAVNISLTQMKAMLPAILMSFFLVFSADLLGRCIRGFLRSRLSRPVFGYVAFVLSAAVIACYGLFFHAGEIGENRTSFYLTGEENDSVFMTGQPSDTADGFDRYLENGPYEVHTMDYGPGDGVQIRTGCVDMSPFAEYSGMIGWINKRLSDYRPEEASVSGRIWVPSGVTKCPVLFIVHGNHTAAVPSYLGYDYLGVYLASNGYVVVSVDENIMNMLSSASDENDGRAVLLLENMKAVLQANDDTGTPLYHRIDPERIAVAGHSRGGETAALTYLFNDLDAYPDNGNIRFDYHFKISAVIAIAPTVDQYKPGEHAVEIRDVSYLLLHGMNDQDVLSVMGEKQYNNIAFSGKADENYVKACVNILGANHGQFNSFWGRYDLGEEAGSFLNTTGFLSKEDQEKIAKAYFRVFLDRALKGEETYASLLYDNRPFRPFLPETVYVTDCMESFFNCLCSFDASPDVTGGDEETTKIVCEAMDTWKVSRDEYGDGSEKENYVLACEWSAGNDAEIKISIPSADLSCGGISFRIADMRENAENASGLRYTVTVCDSKGNKSCLEMPVRVSPSLAVQLYRQDVLAGSYEYKHLMQTVTVSMDRFLAGSRIDASDICEIAIGFDGSSGGKVILDDIGYYEHIKQ